MTSGQVEPWTRAYAPPGVDMGRFSEPQIVRWTSFDGGTISGLLNLDWIATQPDLDASRVLVSGGRITKPLFVVQGRNDPRVPYTEAEQIVERARANGSTVWYLRAENEGHDFARKENADFRLYAFVKFVETVLLR